ncbi:MAG TPA: serine hydrolase domain-containing protein [Dehalococcoidia bacterium]|nr:serine hydrolase domain-containing protein [Dehalococcoidia bacterium]
MAEHSADAIVDQVVPEFERHVVQTMADQRVVGLSIGIVRDQELTWSGGFGWSDLDDPGPPDDRTLYRVDSNTKTVTGTAIMQLRDDGKLGLDDPLVEHIPEFANADIRFGTIEDVTLRRLLTHRSGLNGEVPGDWPYTGVGPSMSEVLSRLDECAVVIPPDSQHKYCNLGFVLLGATIERVTGGSYEDYVRANILDALAMTQSTFEPESSELRRAGQFQGPLWDARPADALQLTHNGRNPAGGLYSNVSEMAKWVSQQFRAERGTERGPGQVLAGTSIEEMHRPQYVEANWKEGQCLAWRAVRSGEHVYLGHGGGNPGSLSYTLFNTQSKTGVVVLTNSDAHTAQLSLAKDALDRLMAAEAAQPKAFPIRPPQPMPEALEPLIGRYESVRGAIARIVWVDNQAVFLGAGAGIPRDLTPNVDGVQCFVDTTDDPHVLIARGGRPAGETLTFEMGDDGVPLSFRMQSGAVYHRLERR